MTGRTRLSWVTVLTILSLLLGGSALNAFADGPNGNKGHGGGSGKVEHQQQGNSAEVRQNVQSSDHGQGQSRAEENRQGRGHDDDEASAQAQDNDEDMGDAAEDLVTQPDQVTDEVRPGLGCGDENHVHTGAPGNPDVECPAKFQEGDEESEED